MRPVTATTTPPAMRWSIGPPAADGKVLRPPANVDVTSSIAKVAEPAEAPAPKLAAAPAPTEKAHETGVTTVAKAVDKAPEPARKAEVRPAATTTGKWIIQLGATDDEAKAKDILARARAKAAGPLAEVTAVTEKVEKGGSTLFRARFADPTQPRFSAGPESLEVGLFHWNEIPWDRIAFPTVRWALDAWRANQTGPLGAPAGNPPEDLAGTARLAGV
jgi:D-alanyl-D-alanine carboxypeptidase